MTGKSIFISHASEDKKEVARPLAYELSKRGFSVWLDEFELKLGDSLRAKIDEGIRRCDFGVVILSDSFFSKEWPQAELDALFTKEVITGKKVLLPVWKDLALQDVARHSAFLAARLGISTEKGIESMVLSIEDATTAVEAKPIKQNLTTPHHLYREFVRVAISQELGISVESITPRSGVGLIPTGPGSVFSGVDLIHIGGHELAELVTVINCDYHPQSEELTSEVEVMRLSYLRNESKASKAMLVSNVGFSAAAAELAKKERVALLKLSPTPETESTLLSFANQSNGEALIEDIEHLINNQSNVTYNKVVVRRLGPSDEGDLLSNLLQNPQAQAMAKEALSDPETRRKAAKILDENPDLRRAAKDILSKFRR